MIRILSVLALSAAVALPAMAAEKAKPAVAEDLAMPVKASPKERAAAMRMEPLARAAFFNREFERDPLDVEAGLNLSEALRALDRHTEAADVAHRVLLFAPTNYEALLAAGKAHIGGNNAFYAVDPLEKAIEVNPKDWRAYSLLGVAFDQIKRTDDAQAMWARALAVSPENPSILTNQAMSLAARGDLVSAEGLLRRAVAQPKAGIQVRQNLALVLGMQGKLPEAEKLLRQDLPPDVADANLLWLQTALKPSAPADDRSWDSVKAGS